MDERFLEVVASIIKDEGLKNERQFLTLINENTATLSKIRSGLLSPGKELLVKLAAKYKINLNYIFSGEGEMFLPSANKESNAEQIEHPPFAKVRFFPIKAMAGYAETYFEDFSDLEGEPEFVNVPIFGPKGFSKAAVVFEIFGDSMEEQLKHGSKVLAEPVNRDYWPYLPSGVYAFIYDRHFVVKRVKDNDLLVNGTLTLHSDNPKAGKNIIKSEDIRHIWAVKEIISSPVY